MKKKIISSLLIVFGIIVGANWNRDGFCIGDNIFIALGLQAWSNGTSGIHYPAVIGAILMIMGIIGLNSTKEVISMKLTYKAQMIISVIIIILGNILTDIFDYWIYRSFGFIICGLLFIAHPVVPKSMEINNKTILWTRIAGVILILIGFFTRVHHL